MKAKKLTLKRETLHELSALQLRRAHGASYTITHEWEDLFAPSAFCPNRARTLACGGFTGTLTSR